MIEAVVYDFGGVFMESPFEAVHQMSDDKGHDYDVAVELLLGSYEDDTDHPWHRAERGELDVVSTREQISELARARDLDLDLFELFKYVGMDREVYSPMVESVRRARSRGCLTAILTNNIAEARGMWKAMLPTEELFDVVVDSSEVGMRKPDLRIYQHTLDLLGNPEPERTVFLDDYPSNVQAAESIGMIGILVGTDRTRAIALLDDLLAGGST